MHSFGDYATRSGNGNTYGIKAERAMPKRAEIEEDGRERTSQSAHVYVTSKASSIVYGLKDTFCEQMVAQLGAFLLYAHQYIFTENQS